MTVGEVRFYPVVSAPELRQNLQIPRVPDSGDEVLERRGGS